jgi:hypothetical protein
MSYSPCSVRIAEQWPQSLLICPDEALVGTGAALIGGHYGQGRDGPEAERKASECEIPTTRLQLQRDPSRDFTADYDSIKAWRGLVWVARQPESWCRTGTLCLSKR